MLNSNLTIVLTLKDREEFTYRWMSYMEENKCKYPILIADGGSSIEIESKLKDYKNYPSLSYRYIRFPYDSSVNIFLRKLRDAVSLVETEYLIFADNDDFFYLESIDQCISFLENHKDYVSCCGKRVFLRLYSKSGNLLNAPQGYYSSLMTYENNRRSIEHESPIARIQYFFQNVDKDSLWMKHYSVTKSSVLKESLEIFQEKVFVDVNSFELYLNLKVLYAGKHKELNSLYYVRQEASSQVTSDLNLHANLVERFLLGKGVEEFFESIPYIDKHLAIDENLKIKRYFIRWLVIHGYGIYSAQQSKHRTFVKYVLYNILNFRISYYLIVAVVSVLNLFRKRKINFVDIPGLTKHVISR